MLKAVHVHPDDNVATALDDLSEGQVLEFGAERVTLLQAIGRGHKLALRSISKGESVLKYGTSIGLATVDIRPGQHVHIHNLESQRGRGDTQKQVAR